MWCRGACGSPAPLLANLLTPTITCVPLSMWACCRAAHSSILRLGKPGVTAASAAQWHQLAELATTPTTSLVCHLLLTRFWQVQVSSAVPASQRATQSGSQQASNYASKQVPAIMASVMPPMSSTSRSSFSAAASSEAVRLSMK